MMATIYMIFEDDPNEYPYGTYPFNTSSDKNRLNEIAKKLADERGCFIRIAKNPQNI